jgi:diguanylate cyclase (GGDEF)-like protein
MIDLDHLKGLNDTYGHAAGDEVLHQLGILLGTQIRGSDIVCRFGGDEFVMILPEASLKVTLERAEGLRLEAKELTVLFGGLTVEVITLSIGVAVFPNHGTTRLPLLAAVDAAMYRAKREGRNRVAAAEDVKQGP